MGDGPVDGVGDGPVDGAVDGSTAVAGTMEAEATGDAGDDAAGDPWAPTGPAVTTSKSRTPMTTAWRFFTQPTILRA